MELEDGACIGVFDEFLLAMPGDAMEEFLIVHVEVDVLLFQFFDILLNKVGSDFVGLQ